MKKSEKGKLLKNASHVPRLSRISRRTIEKPEDNLSSSSSLFDSDRNSVESDRHKYAYFLSSATEKLYSLSDIERDSDESDSLSSNAARAMEEMNLELPAVPDFFEVLGTAISLSDLTIETSEEIKLDQLKSVKLSGETAGTFVDPLTGQKLSSSSSTETTEEEAVVATVKEESSEGGPIFFDVKLPDLPIDKSALKKKKYDDEMEDELDIFFEPVKDRETVQFDFEALEREEAAVVLERSIKQMLISIVNNVVAKSEYIDRRTLLNNALDKAELMRLLEEKLNILNQERSINRFLNVKCYVHFHQKGMKRFLIPDKKGSKRRKKYYEKLKFLDQLMYQKKTLSELLANKISKTLEALQELEERVTDAQESFDELVLQTLTKGRSENFTRIVEEQLAIMRTDLKELSALRVKLILIQHAHVVLKNRLTKANDIGGGITIDDLERIEAEIQTMDKKFEAMGTELQILQHTFNKVQHSRAHLSEKIRIQEILVGEKEGVFDKIIDQREALKADVNELTEEHNMIFREMQEVIDTSGILCKPLLLQDYDNVTEKLANVKAKKEEYKREYTQMLKDIEEAEAKCQPPDDLYDM
ncbi:uncharacterized protein LOC119685184 [Teleopsis dalmanni]|uniref:uncharacterized protein LOC119685184 n=1 Tax=Teleopsis dalmanni TaxID=139649 RepID=UPI0018CF0162|nr:uncharacterized protein LOC119685184 [Teleopsis dalmanni]